MAFKSVCFSYRSS